MTSPIPLRKALAFGLIAVSLLIALFPPAPLSPVQGQTLAIILLTLGLWATSLVPNYLAALIFFAAALILKLAPAPLVFSGFSSAAIWLIVSGFVIGSAISLSGLGDKLAAALAPMLTGSYLRLIGGLMLIAMFLGFLMPSSVGRAVALIPAGMALAARCGFEPGSNGRIGIAVVLAIGCNMPSFAILPSNIPNMVLSGAAETIYGTHFSYVDYLLLHYPVLGIVKSALIVFLVLKLFPAKISRTRGQMPDAAPQKPEAGNAATARLKTSVILMMTLGFWATDSLHGINPAWIGLAAAILLMLPGIGIVPPQSFKTSADFGTLLFVAGALAVGTLVNQSGLGTLIGQGLQAVLPLAPAETGAQTGAQGLVNFLSLTLMSFGTSLVATVPSAPAVLTPMAQDLATASGFSLDAVLMTQVPGFSTVLLPYQVAPLIIAMQMSGERLTHLTRLLLPLTALTLLLLLPLDYLWWRLLGWV